MYNKAHRTPTPAATPITEQEPSPSLGAAALSPLVQFRVQPAGALVAPGGRGRCCDPPGAAGGDVWQLEEHAAMAAGPRRAGMEERLCSTNPGAADPRAPTGLLEAAG